MKLLSLTIGQMENSFRSLYQGFEINFHSLSDHETMEEFRPFCFAGLNGSGKSNVLEALANIFYHLEICVARYLPDSIRDRKNFKREVCNPDAFTLKYLIGQHDGSIYSYINFHKVTISKEVGKEPTMTIQEFPFDNSKKEIPISLKSNLETDEPAPAKSYLPDHVIGYSSGENEILSLPFVKARLVHLDEFKQYTINGVARYDEPENGLIYIDNAMSQAVLLSCLLLENKEALKPLQKEIGIECLESFRMHINLKNFKYEIKKEHSITIEEKSVLTILENEQIDRFKRCATSWFINNERLVLDFYVGKDSEDGYNATKKAFETHFENSLELFQAFRLLYELNNHFIDDHTKEEVYRSHGYYTDGKIPIGGPDDDVFHFLDFMIIKKMKDSEEEKSLLLRNFSDGEHQLLHTMGICLLLKAKRALLLLDEPETHFNPSWRAKFIKMLNDSITAGNKKDYPNGRFNVHYLKDILLTSHSPFVISDCLPNNVIFFDKDKETNLLKVKKASEMGIKTYGAGVDYILKNIFKTQMISAQSFEEMKNLIKTGSLDELRNAVDFFGESSQKQFIFKRIFELTQGKDDSEHTKG
ncbi:restriction system-associated AAA family ATPase [Elizabethkingia anophelis]|uniref:restriction system-associated AAA family ATPase n=1 Tax=Elizabethkingia anophelis TaxID=1117645 RepID=UPI0021A40A68|nr:restriction system-associated AAA family ATPase [Elizabethkingia anophelis]